MLPSNSLESIQFFFFQEIINIFIQQGCMELFKIDSKDMYNVIKDFYFI